MFEKEAEEYYDTTAPIISEISYLDFENGVKLAFKDGAEFGYNKANEWHYGKDGALPKENKKYWVLTSDREPKVDSWLNISWVNSYDVIAWKEIVLPKESE